jgi:hypothetical protein
MITAVPATTAHGYAVDTGLPIQRLPREIRRSRVWICN